MDSCPSQSSHRATDPYKQLSYWFDTLPGPITPRPALSQDIQVDVAVVGAGCTGP